MIMSTKLLNASDIESIVIKTGLDELIDELTERLADQFTKLYDNPAQIPPRTGIQYMDPDLGLIEWMPASIAQGTASVKLVAYHPTNPAKRQLPTVISSICLFDTHSGHLSGILDGTFLTALRTGAMSAVATRSLASRSSKILGMFGCGAQAVTQTHALSRVLDFDEIIAYDIDPLALSSFNQRISFTGIPVRCVTKAEIPTLLEQADVLCTCTSASPGSGPLFPDFNHKPWLHINAVGSDFPEKFELPLDLLKRSFVCPDFRAQAKIEGECQQLEANQIGYELAELLCKPELATQQRERLTVFDSTGHAFADYVTGLLFMQYAEKLGLGTDMEIECLPADPKDPYSFMSESTKQPHTSRIQVSAGR